MRIFPKQLPADSLEMFTPTSFSTPPFLGFKMLVFGSVVIFLGGPHVEEYVAVLRLQFFHAGGFKQFLDLFC